MFTTLNNSIGYGWKRTDGRIGLRNHVIAFSTVALTDRVTALAAAQVSGVLPIVPAFQRGLRGTDAALQKAMINAIITHPNVGAALVVTHDRASADEISAFCVELDKPIIVVPFMAYSGMQSAQSIMITHLQFLLSRIYNHSKIELKLSDLVVALECGGSDATSALCANPSIGRFVDRLIDAGGTAIVSETAEFLGGEEVVRAQSKSPEIADSILAHMAAEEDLMRSDGTDYRGVNPTEENIEAGLSTLTEKTMGALCKIGSSNFSGALNFGEAPKGKGLFFMNTPFFSPTSLTGMVLGGAQISLFAMGVFNPSGLPLAPTIKICGNPKTLSDWSDSIDLDVSGIISRQLNYDEAAEAILTTVRQISDGKLTCAEKFQEGQIILPLSKSPL
jgi:altronate dehydratase large subunit